MASKRQFSPCIDIIMQAAKTVGVELSDKQSNQILNELGNHAVALAPQYGGDVVAAMRKIAQDAAVTVKIRREAFRRSKILNLKAEKEMILMGQRFAQDYTFGEGLLSVLEGSIKGIFNASDSVDGRYKAYNESWTTEVGSKIKQVVSFKELRSGVHDVDIAKERAELSRANGTPGLTGNKVATEVAKILHENWVARTRAINLAGGFRRAIQNFFGEQSHDPARIKALGMTQNGYDKDVAFKKWADIMMTRLDPVATFKGNPPMAFLKSVFNHLETQDFTHSNFESVDTFPNGMSLADRVSQKERVLIFKDAESYVAHQKDFGRNDILDTAFSNIQFDARSAAVMEKVGPGGFDNFRKALNTLKREALERPDSAKQVASLKEERLIGAWRMASGEADLPGQGWLAKTQANLQNLVVGGSQGMVILSTPGDAGFQGLWSSRLGLGVFQTLVKDIGYLFGSNNSPEMLAKRAELIRLGVGAESFANNSTGRFAISEKGSTRLNKWIQIQYDWNGLNWWTRNLKMASSDALLTGLAAFEQFSISGMPQEMQILLGRYGIGDADWAAMKATIKDVGGDRWITTDGLDPKVAQKLRTMVLMEADTAVPTPGARERRFLTFGGTKAGTVSGTLARLVSFLHSYAVTVNSKVLPQEVYGRGNKNWKDWATGGGSVSAAAGSWARAGSLAAASFILTAVGMAARDALSGRNPRPFTDKDGNPHWNNIREIAQRSGAAGLLGELVLQEWQRGFKDPSTYLSGVLVQKYLDPLATIPWDAARGDDRWVGKTVELGKSLTPFANMIFVRQVADYVLLSRLQEALDHGSINRAKENLERRTGQTYFNDPNEYFLK